jgi:hypothetical protein
MHGLSTVEDVKDAHFQGVYPVSFCGLRLSNKKDASHV